MFSTTLTDKNTTDVNTDTTTPKERTEMQVNGWNVRFSKRKKKWQVRGRAYDYITEKTYIVVHYETDSLDEAKAWAKATPYFTMTENYEGNCGECLLNIV